MTDQQETLALKDFRRIPGVGKALAKEFVRLGFTSVDSLKNASPEKMYQDLCAIKMAHIDRCVLYVFRCAVYFATEQNHQPELLKWWSWKDKEYIL